MFGFSDVFFAEPGAGRWVWTARQLEADLFKLLQQQRLKLINTYLDWTPRHSLLPGSDSSQTVEHKRSAEELESARLRSAPARLDGTGRGSEGPPGQKTH